MRPLADLLNQAKSTAASAMNTASNLATQAANTASDLATQAVNSQAAETITGQAKALGAQAQVLGGQAQAMAGNLAGQAHAQALSMAPDYVPAPASGGSTGGLGATGEVDRSADIEPQDEAEKAKFEKLFDSRPTPAELQDKGILKGKFTYCIILRSLKVKLVTGAPGDSLAGKRQDLEKSMLQVSYLKRVRHWRHCAMLKVALSEPARD